MNTHKGVEGLGAEYVKTVKGENFIDKLIKWIKKLPEKDRELETQFWVDHFERKLRDDKENSN